MWFVGCKGFKVEGNNGKPALKYFMMEVGLMSDGDNSDSGKKKKGEG